MDKLNQGFQAVLKERGFLLKIDEQEFKVKYQGRLSLTPERLVDFALLIPKSDGREVVQVVFDKLLVCPDESGRKLTLELLNQLNLTTGLYYYFSLREDGTVFARYMLPVDPDRTEILVEVLQVGSRLVRQALDILGEDL